MSSSRNLQLACIIGTVLSLVTGLAALIASGFFPPIPPSWTAEQTVSHYRSHARGMEAGVVLLIVSGTLYMGTASVTSTQMRRMTGQLDAAAMLQLSLGVAFGYGAFILPGIVLAAANYRLERAAEMTQVLNDLFWFLLNLTTPAYQMQNCIFAYVILQDTRPEPPFPKIMAYINMTVALLLVPALGLHCVKTGPLAWNGAWTWWVALVVYGVQQLVEVVCLTRAVLAEGREGTGSEPSALVVSTLDSKQ
ncbi:membrane protein [Ophiocordyceps camponoti-floridani]|uniref:Membrane protein n=1 Tax=Ophiocordyceps camponoti-floridani TaxID=2030778 RepID=A0A8H4QDK0_9HYPO|nr:membrane protein [Ophiocordyceps camponoti-floridani]